VVRDIILAAILLAIPVGYCPSHTAIELKRSGEGVGRTGQATFDDHELKPPPDH